MRTITDLLNSTRRAAYSWWRAFASRLVRVLIYCVVLSSLFAASDGIQSAEYGVLLFVIFLGLVVWGLFGIFETYSDIRPPEYSEEAVAKAKKWAFAVIVLVPVGISWLSNETLYGAINPVGYWKAELSNTAEKDCSTFTDLLARSAEETRVVENKYRMGIATAFEVKESVESLKLVNDLHLSCATSAEKRRTEARKRLTQLGKKY